MVPMVKKKKKIIRWMIHKGKLRKLPMVKKMKIVYRVMADRTIEAR